MFTICNFTWHTLYINDFFLCMQERPLNFTQFNSAADAKTQTCAAFEKPPSDYAWNDVKCTKEFCVVCASQTQPKFRLRGLCEQEDGETGGLLHMESLIDDATRKYRFRLRFVRIYLNLFLGPISI